MRDINKYEKDYIELPFEWYQSKYRKKRILESLLSFKHDYILEIGCGLDPIFNYVENFNKFMVIEPSNVFYNKAQNIAKDNSRIEVIEGFFEDKLSVIERKKFDFIIVSSLLHEVENPELFLKLLYKISNKDTVIHINVPNAHSFHRILAEEMGLIKSIYQQSLTQIKMQQSIVFDIDLLVEYVENAGFRVINKGSFFIKPFTHEQMQILLDANQINDNTMEGLYKMSSHFPKNGSEIYVDIIKL